MNQPPLLIEVSDFEAISESNDSLVVDLCSEQSFLAGHIAGAKHIAPSRLQRGEKPAVGKIPSQEALAQLVKEIGLTPDRHVIAYDDEGSGWAGRFIWTLDAIGHSHYSVLNGGLVAWKAAGRALEQGAVDTHAEQPDYKFEIHDSVIASQAEVEASIDDNNVVIWDARSPEEYSGEKVVAARGGHIPGAVNLDWERLKDPERDLRLRDLATLNTELDRLGITPDKTVITHCQTHHRSGLSYLVMKLLGYTNIKGYDGSWGEWGNAKDTPVTSGTRP